MFQKENKNKIMKLFFNNPNKEFYLREISRLTKVSPSGSFRILNKLEGKNLIVRNKNKAVTNFKLKNNEDVKRLKRLFNINSVYESKLVDFLIDKYNNPTAIVLFGSYSLGEDNEKGDIDIAVITKKHKDLDLLKFERYLGKSIHLLEVDLDKVSKEFKNNLANGFILGGYLSL